MSANHSQLTTLHELTKEIIHKVNVIKENMEENEPEQVETLQLLVEERGKSLKELEEIIEEPGFQWSSNERIIIKELKALNDELEPKLKKFYLSFLKQLKRINQSKQVTNKYAMNAEGVMDGAYIDKRK